MCEKKQETSFVAELSQFIFSILLLSALVIFASKSILHAVIYYVLIGIYIFSETHLTFHSAVEKYKKDYGLELNEKELKTLGIAFPIICGLFWVVFPAMNILIRLGLLKDPRVKKEKEKCEQ